MKKKKARYKAYLTKYKNLERSEKTYVRKVLFVLAVCMFLAVIAIFTVAYLGYKNLHVRHWEQDTIKDKKQFAEYVQKQEEEIAVADEVNTSDEEAQLLARVVNAEIGGGSREAQIAVASVILNRVESDLFPNSITEVIYQEGQYECVINGAIYKEPTEMATESAYFVYQNKSQIPCNVLYQAEFVQGSGVWAFIDNEYFCYQ